MQKCWNKCAPLSREIIEKIARFIASLKLIDLGSFSRASQLITFPLLCLCIFLSLPSLGELKLGGSCERGGVECTCINEVYRERETDSS